MTLVLARCLEDPAALLAELEEHWRRGDLVGLAAPLERQTLLAAVLGTAAEGHASRGSLERPWPPQPGPALPEQERPATAVAPDHLAEQRHPDPQALGPALVLGSGGSSGGRRWCLQPLGHLRASAEACGAWLGEQGIDPGDCLHLDALPLHHVSGLMPVIRVRQWRAQLRWLAPELLRMPERLPEACPLPPGRPVLLSLVPTQLQRLLSCPEATRWLAGCAVIWVGGAALNPELADRARAEGLPLSPCYGATETAAMVCAMPPDRFLAGEQGCGAPLGDVELRLEGAERAIALRTSRISPGWFAAGRLEPVAEADGWWRSGDAGIWIPTGKAESRDGTAGDCSEDGFRGGNRTTATRNSAAPGSPMAATSDVPVAESSAGGGSLRILGRLDGAIHSGGETVFPEQVRQRLLDLIEAAGLPVAQLLVLGEADPDWGERLVALVRWQPSAEGSSPAGDGSPLSGIPDGEWLERLTPLARLLPQAERPRRWLACPNLEPSPAGKWELQRWRNWIRGR